MTQPQLGELVHYKLSDHDADEINRRRHHAKTHRQNNQQTGHQTHHGNHAYAGDVYAAHIVRVFGAHSSRANLQVHLDGTDTHWVTSAAHGHGLGDWHRPGDTQPEPEPASERPHHSEHPENQPHHNQD